MSDQPPEEPAVQQEWVKTVHRPGGTFVTVSLWEPGFSAKWTAKTYATMVPAGVREARAGAQRAMAEQKAAVVELDVEKAKTKGRAA